MRVKLKIPQKTLNLNKVVTGLDEIASSFYYKLTKKDLPFWANLSQGCWSNRPSKERIYNVFEVLHQTEQTPHPDNRVMLGDGLDKIYISGCLFNSIMSSIAIS